MSDRYDPDKIMDPETARAVDLGAAGILVTGDVVDSDAPDVHKMYAAINIGVRDRGEVWEKCANCGNPYMHTEEWSASTVCSERCFTQFSASLSEGW